MLFDLPTIEVYIYNIGEISVFVFYTIKGNLNGHALLYSLKDGEQ